MNNEDIIFLISLTVCLLPFIYILFIATKALIKSRSTIKEDEKLLKNLIEEERELRQKLKEYRK